MILIKNALDLTVSFQNYTPEDEIKMKATAKVGKKLRTVDTACTA